MYDIYFEALEYCVAIGDSERGLKVLNKFKQVLTSNEPVNNPLIAKERKNAGIPEKVNKKKRNAIPSWSTIRRDILRRDESKCRICSKDYYLHVHHIDYDRSNNNESNLVTLCESCHRALHAEGYKPIDHPDVPPPWEKTNPIDYNDMNQEYTW